MVLLVQVEGEFSTYNAAGTTRRVEFDSASCRRRPGRDGRRGRGPLDPQPVSELEPDALDHQLPGARGRGAVPVVPWLFL
ncbi:MAG TPA: hypothetical protein VJ787_00340, partial [Thermoleophilia bacterium]|nr:hypothetical protein [Thermoleophilia bacterium]